MFVLFNDHMWLYTHYQFIQTYLNETTTLIYCDQAAIIAMKYFRNSLNTR